ncbi:MAG TPA: alpha/beta hydrolase [Stellaceae bacterium]|nr:alpha/beta hydrolase [Stellaceae bacterium]
MQASTFTLAGADGVELFVHRWLPEGPAKAALHVAHGLAEHGGRYARLAQALTGAGYAVYAGDHRGHGRTARTPADLGFFAEHDGWRRCLDDLGALHRRLMADHPGLPVVLLGHSMGSFMAQQVISERGETLAGAVLSGSGGKPGALAAAGRLVARIERLRLGARGKSALIHGLSFGAFNKPFAPARTPFDWLSRDPAEVDKYIADPLCGFVATVQLWIDLLDALGDVTDARRQARIPKRLPVYVISGSRDPVGENTKSVQQLLAAYRDASLERVAHRFYPEARHELFNELNRDEVTRDLVAWLDGVVAR